MPLTSTRGRLLPSRCRAPTKATRRRSSKPRKPPSNRSTRPKRMSTHLAVITEKAVLVAPVDVAADDGYAFGNDFAACLVPPDPPNMGASARGAPTRGAGIAAPTAGAGTHAASSGATLE